MLIMVFPSFVKARVIYVDVTCNGSGTSWPDACETIGQAMTAAAAGDQIWVADGTYNEKVVFKSGVMMYGGFAGGESHLEERDYYTNLSIINASNSGTAVKLYLVAPNTRLDGFVVTGGNDIHGGGIEITASGAVVTNNIIKGNLTNGIGAGIYCFGFDPVNNAEAVITNNIISGNFAYDDEGNGGGIGCHGSSPLIANNIITRNLASRNGGGIACFASETDALVLCSSPIIENNYILANTTSILEGAAGVNIGGGGIFCTATDLSGQPITGAVCEALIINNVVGANGAWKGGGICAVDSVEWGVTIINNTIVANSGSGIFWSNTSPLIFNNLVAYNTWGMEQFDNFFTNPIIGNNCVYGNTVKGAASNYKDLDDLTGIDGNISGDPKLAGYPYGEFHIQPGSSCIDAGDPDAVGIGWTDIDNQNRIMGTTVDIGADESDGTSWSVQEKIVYVKPDGNDFNDGFSWMTAKKTVAAGINTAASNYGEVWVAAGTYAESITLPAFVYLYGGFNGTETAREQRDYQMNATILDSNAQGTVVSCMNGGYLVTRLDGFTVQNGAPLIQNMKLMKRGGGFWMVSCGPVICNNIIQYNDADDPMWPGFLLDGGGIYCFHSYPHITDNTISNNAVNGYPDGKGGGIYSQWSVPNISRNILTNNIARAGSAIFAEVSEVFVEDNIISNNSGIFFYGAAQGAVCFYICQDFIVNRNIISGNLASTGAGISASTSDKGQITNNLIINNRAYEPASGSYGMGGGIYLQIPMVTTDTTYITNNTICGNQANTMFDDWGGGIGIAPLSNNLVIANNIIAFNSSGIFRQLGSPGNPTLDYNCVYNPGGDEYGNLTPGLHDLSVDPQFVNRTAGNYRLLSGSACIDSGDNLSVPGDKILDLNGWSRFIDDLCKTDDGRGAPPIIDRGAYEYLRSDIDSGGSVDLADFAAIASRWLAVGCGDCDGTDLTCDGNVSLEDFDEFAQYWMMGS